MNNLGGLLRTSHLNEIMDYTECFCYQQVPCTNKVWTHEAFSCTHLYNRLFFIEHSYMDLPPEERKARRLETEPEVLEKLWVWFDTFDLVRSKMEKAVNYARNHKEKLINYILDGRCEISNNAAEHWAKVYTTARKNFLFHDAEKWAEASAIIFSIIETTKANGLNRLQCIYTLLLFMPNHKDPSASMG